MKLYRFRVSNEDLYEITELEVVEKLKSYMVCGKVIDTVIPKGRLNKIYPKGNYLMYSLSTDPVPYIKQVIQAKMSVVETAKSVLAYAQNELKEWEDCLIKQESEW